MKKSYYIPTIDGEKPISIESIDGLQNKSLDDEFLVWLANNIYSSLGIPMSFIESQESIDFAKTITMQNSRFIRDILSEQMILGRGYTELLRKLYHIEFLSDEKETIEAEKAANINRLDLIFDINTLEVKFPSPVSLNMTNIADQISTISSINDALVDTIHVNEDDKELATALFKEEMYKKFIVQLDWEAIEEIQSKVKVALKKEKLLKKKNEGTSGSSSSGDMDSSDEGDMEEEPVEGEESSNEEMPTPPEGM